MSTRSGAQFHQEGQDPAPEANTVIQQLQQQLQQLQQQLAALQQNQQQEPPAQAAANPVVFARAPAQLNSGALLNYSEKKDIEVHKSGSAALPGDKYDGTKLQQFLGKVESHARSLE